MLVLKDPVEKAQGSDTLNWQGPSLSPVTVAAVPASPWFLAGQPQSSCSRHSRAGPAPVRLKIAAAQPTEAVFLEHLTSASPRCFLGAPSSSSSIGKTPREAGGQLHQDVELHTPAQASLEGGRLPRKGLGILRCSVCGVWGWGGSRRQPLGSHPGIETQGPLSRSDGPEAGHTARAPGPSALGLWRRGCPPW